MLKFLALIPFLFLLFVQGAHAQALNPAQLVSACTACKGDNACDTPRSIGDSVAVLTWLNAPRAPAVAAWYVAAPQEMIESAPSYTSYDTLSQGKRDSWLVLLRSQRDFTRGVIRNWVVDVWGNPTTCQ